MADEVALLDCWPSIFGMRVRIALAEKEIKYEYKEENLLDKSPLLLKMNPIHKKIPVLIHNGKTICESLVILQYIDEVWRDKSPLLPSDPYQRSVALFWADYVDKKIPDCMRRLSRSKGEAQEKAKVELIEHLKVIEKELEEKAFFGGDNMGFVDVVIVPLTSWFYALETGGNFSIEEKCPKLLAWAKRCMEKDSVSKSLPHPHKIYEFVLERNKLFGIE